MEGGDSNQTHGYKYLRMSNGDGRLQLKKIARDDEEDAETKRGGATGGGGSGSVDLGGFYGWPSSRIVRVSRASGGKDRHSKVLTSKGLRDRRVRLSVNTAIQFYDLQDRLGYDQPSKALEWLLKAAASSISELPSINTAVFPDTPKQLSDEKQSSSGVNDPQGFDSDEHELEMDGENPTKLHKSSTGNCPGFSLSRSVNRIKARERPKERVEEKEKEKEVPHLDHLNHLSQTTSFTELLCVGINNVSDQSNKSKIPRQWTSTPMDYFSTTGLLGPSTTQIHLGNPLSQPMASASLPFFSVSGHDHHPVFQHIHNGSDEYNLNFTMSSSTASSGLSGFNRGTLQSNSSSSSLFPSVDGSPSFFMSTTLPGFDPGLQLCYSGDTFQKEKRKN